MAAVALWSGLNAKTVADHGAVVSSTEWVSGLGLALDLRVDGFSLLMICLVSGIGLLVIGYARFYFGNTARGLRAASLLTAFSGAMLGVVTADNLLLLFVCWELTSITSYLLIGIDHQDPKARAAATHALLVTAMGGLAMLAGLVLIGTQAATMTLSEVLAAPPSGAVTSVALLLVLLGCFTKSAQYPFHSWLPGAMVSPTPISAYLHSAAMVKAGIYLVARLAPAFATVGFWRPLVVGVGLTTMIAGGLRALRPFDLKQVLAFGTISQLGFMMVLVGLGKPETTAAGAALLIAHGLFKAALFMVVGVIDHQIHTRDLRRLGELGAGWMPVRIIGVVSAASMAAVIPLAGFVAKEEAYAALLHGSTGDRLVLVGIVAGSVLTVAYSARIAAALVTPASGATSAATSTAPVVGFWLPAGMLASATVVFGLLPMVWSPLVDHASRALTDLGGSHAVHHVHLALWHGPTLALGLSLMTLALGAAMFAARRPITRLQDELARPLARLDGTRLYEATVEASVIGARRLTRVVQSGSLPTYAAVVFTVAAVAPLVALSAGNGWPDWPNRVGNPGQAAAAGLLIVAGIAATIVTRRFAAAVLLGVAGYAMALMFAIQGAPDLALTQFGVETLSVVVFLLVMRNLPRDFDEARPAVAFPLRLAISVAIGVSMVVMALASNAARTEVPVSAAMAEQALPVGHGRNIVNVILVDIRGLDTLGEATVLATAAMAITAVARAGTKPRRRGPKSSADGVVR